MKEVTCQICGYTWETRTILSRVSCPNCGNKVKTGITIKDQNEVNQNGSEPRS